MGSSLARMMPLSRVTAPSVSVGGGLWAECARASRSQQPPGPAPPAPPCHLLLRHLLGMAQDSRTPWTCQHSPLALLTQAVGAAGAAGRRGWEQEHSPCWALSPGLGTRPEHQGSLPVLAEAVLRRWRPLLLSSLGTPGHIPRAVFPASLPNSYRGCGPHQALAGPTLQRASRAVC